MLQSFDLLDLTISLTPPPENAPADALASMTVGCDALGLNHAAGLLTDPLTPQERADLRWYLEEYSQWPYAEFAVRGKHIEAQLSEIGKRLYQTAFGAVMGQVQPWRLLPTKQRQISIVSTVPAALSLPWELLHDEQGFLVLRTRQPVALLRRLEQHELSELPIAFKPPLRVLVVTARPSGTGFLDPRSLPRELLDAVQPQINAGAVEVEFLRPPTRAALRQRLAQAKNPVHLLHFDGHGVFAGQIDPHDTQRKRGGGQGLLAFEDAEGKLDLVKAEDLAQLLQDSGVKLVVLDACQSAMSADDDAFSSVAARLIQGGVDAAVAMSASVLVVTSTRFFARFYRELAAGTPVPIAQERARQDLYDDPRRHLFRRRADEEGQPVELRDWWLPHYYQQRPLTLRATRAPKKRKSPSNTALSRFNNDMPKEPRYGFEGRARELLQIERHLLRKRLVILSGFGGVGKTALAREAADWLTRTGMYACACFVSFEHGGDAPLLLSTLGTFLGINDGDYNPLNPKAALARLQSALSAHPTLLIADNLESLLPTGDAPLEQAARNELWHILRELADLGAGVLFTSRDPLASEDQLAPGEQVYRLPLRGLVPPDAYALASRLLTRLDIPHASVPYTDLRDLLAQLDHHPLAIQLVLPTLRDRSLATIRADFAALLLTFTDNHTEERNRSLLASLDYSLRRLSPEQRALLLRLAIFEGGVNETALLEITQITQETWAPLRLALEQAALLVAEQVHEQLIAPLFLHFHPVLVPYLHQPAAEQEDKAQRQRYARYYAAVADSYQEKAFQHPEPVYALIQRELPNLRAALACLLQAGDLDAASRMADIFTQFLSELGRIRERDHFREHMDQILAAASDSEELTHAVYLHEIRRAEDERVSGKIQAALTRITRLLVRIQALPDGAEDGPNSFSHCSTLEELGLCLLEARQYSAAQEQFQAALALLDALLRQKPEEHHLRRKRAILFAKLGRVSIEQGQYAQAQTHLEQALQEHRTVQDTFNEAVTLGHLGNLVLDQQDYSQALSYYQHALQLSHALGDLEGQATYWFQLGMVAWEQHAWPEAERYYRESLALSERIGNTARAAGTCNQLANVTLKAGRSEEAEGWFRRALEGVEPGGVEQAEYLNNLAAWLVGEVQAGRTEQTRLSEARAYLEQVRRIMEQPGVSASIWTIYSNLAEIAELEEQPEVVRDYRRRERESYAAFAGNRFQIDQQLGPLISDIVAATRGNSQAQAAVSEVLSMLNQHKRHVNERIQLIWQGERDWQVLAEGLNGPEALLLLRVLETLASPDEAAQA